MLNEIVQLAHHYWNIPEKTGEIWIW